MNRANEKWEFLLFALNFPWRICLVASKDIIPCPILNKEKVKIVFCYFYVLKHHRVPTNLNKMDPDMQVFDAILTGIHVCESKGVFNVFFDCS